jgi:deoxyribodipyrimidine photolyase-related protein
LILGDQLDVENAALKDLNPKTDEVLMVESAFEAQHVWSHKVRITLFLSAMRHFAEHLKSLDIKLTYIEHSPKTIAEELRKKIKAGKFTHLVCVEPGEWRLKKAIEDLAAELKIILEIRQDTHFYCSHEDFKEWVADKKELRLEYFYRLMRKTHGVLIDQDGKPEGGQWNFDRDNRKPFPKKGPGLIPSPELFKPDAITKTVMAEVEQRYPDHPGSLAHFQWPVTRKQALQALEGFVEHRLATFGIYEDAMWTGTPFGWHSLLSSSLNLKLLNPREVVNAVLAAWKKYDLEMATVEGFIRQILGWREFIRGMYYLDMPQMALDNFYEHKNALPAWYWTGKTGMKCMQETIGQTLEYGYAHHIQRLMVTGNFALLAEMLPKDVCDWYLAVYVDAVEWVELPNVAGMALFTSGGRFTSKPYIASGAYIKRMSNYCGSCQYKTDVRFGEDACPITNLYWNFLIKHRAQFEASPRTRLMTANLSRISDADQRAIQVHAKKLLKNLNSL